MTNDKTDLCKSVLHCNLWAISGNHVFFHRVFQIPYNYSFLENSKTNKYNFLHFQRGHALFPGDLKPVPGNIEEDFLPGLLWLISAAQHRFAKGPECLCPEEPWEFCLQRTFCSRVLGSPSPQQLLSGLSTLERLPQPTLKFWSQPSGMAWGKTASGSEFFPWE